VGIPKGVVNIVTALENTPEVGHTLTTHPDIKISFTGSTRVGKLLMGQAFSTVKRDSWELGGNAPFIVFDDIEDIDTAGRWRSCVEVPRYWTHLRLR
jgi:succinate-semialdehyde dehydrogenase/glutarate-semialdehyde dehydrogenase